MGKGKGLITKGRYELSYRGTKCLNCGHPLDVSDKYCPNCSQANSTKKLVLKDFFDEFFSSLVNYDSKLLKTLYALLVKPGTITKDYVRGKRVSYTNPFRFLLSLAFIYFLMFTYNNNFSRLDRFGKQLNDNIKQTGPFSFSMESGTFTNDNTALREEIDKALKQQDSLGQNTTMIKEQINNLDSLITTGQKKEIEQDSLILADPKAYFKTIGDSTDSNIFYEKMGYFSLLMRNDSIESFHDAQTKYGIENSASNRMAFNFSSSALRAIEKPGSFINTTISRLPFVVFFFLPAFAVFIWVVYIRKKYTYTDHLIFSFHNQSLLFILLILSLIVDAIFNTASAGLFLLVFAIYLYKAMRRFYGQGRFKTIVKYIFLNTVFAFLALLTIMLLFTGSVFTY
ncbi:DUF3667 domain-containing protein [Allomuricauda sp. SCSIO 65647]|uniref:DUF3667 domain-containing protein n=1 Tax=Allomuricauda sp. SCSIO 65647 TaxID=2908843 RepID=UPI001F44DDAC|nr:DUF3667 domain-containing protein [Muricauda sp. SCSIO 65647]UJH68171.1 DUF3667 domain-containing protein [Muricauda sp. SCSIO 65647]